MFLDSFVMNDIGVLYKSKSAVVQLENAKGNMIGVLPAYMDVQENMDERVWDITLEKNHIFLVRHINKEGVSSIPVFSGNCGSGNLMIRLTMTMPTLSSLTSCQKD